MSQQETLKNLKQGQSLIQSHPQYTGTVYNYDGKGLERRQGADQINDLHTTGLPASGHVHRDPNLPFANGNNGLAVKSQTLVGSKYSQKSKYETPIDISNTF